MLDIKEDLNSRFNKMNRFERPNKIRTMKLEKIREKLLWKSMMQMVKHLLKVKPLVKPKQGAKNSHQVSRQ